MSMVQWNGLPAANAQSYDMLITIADGEANHMTLIAGDGNGPEAYRKLSARYESYGKVSEPERINKLKVASTCRGVHEGPRAVEAWEWDWAVYKIGTGEDLPGRAKTNTRLRLIPSEFEEEIRLRKAHSGEVYATLRLPIFEYAMRRTIVSRPLYPLGGDGIDDEMVWVPDEELASFALKKPGRKLQRTQWWQLLQEEAPAHHSELRAR